MTEINYNEIINETTSRHYNVRDEFKDNTIEENREICRNESLGFGVAALSITGDLNIGMMIRTASLLGAEKFFIFGRRQYDRRSTVGAHKYIDVERIEGISAQNIMEVCLDNGYIPVYVEQGGDDIKHLSNFKEQMGELKPLFVFGSESEGISETVMRLTGLYMPCIRLSIPQCGVLRSFNVSTAMSIVTWEWARLFMDN